MVGIMVTTPLLILGQIWWDATSWYCFMLQQWILLVLCCSATGSSTPAAGFLLWDNNN
jgi:hypothetical protein